MTELILHMALRHGGDRYSASIVASGPREVSSDGRDEFYRALEEIFFDSGFSSIHEKVNPAEEVIWNSQDGCNRRRQIDEVDIIQDTVELD